MIEDKHTEYLKGLGAQEREVRSVLSNPSSTLDSRKQAMTLLNDLLIYLRGYFSSLEVTLQSRTEADKYRKFYEQARSKNGVGKRKIT